MTRVTLSRMHFEDRGRVDLQVRIGRLERRLGAERRARLWMIVGAAVLGALGTASATRLFATDATPACARLAKKAEVTPVPSASTSSIAGAHELVRASHDAMNEGALGLAGSMLDAAEALIRRERVSAERVAFLLGARGRFLWEQGRYPESQRMLDAAVSADPTFASSYLYRADLHTSLGNHGAACADLGRYLALTPVTNEADRHHAESEARRLGCR